MKPREEAVQENDILKRYMHNNRGNKTGFFFSFFTMKISKIANVGRLHLHSQVSASVGQETVGLHVLEGAFDAAAFTLWASVADNDVCVGLSACFSWQMWATRIFNPLHQNLFFSFFF